MSGQSFSIRSHPNCESEEGPDCRQDRKIKFQGKQPPLAETNNRKKIRCQLYDQGRCIKGLMCNFSHRFIPDVAKKFCKQFLVDACGRGEQCPFSHNTARYPCRSLYIQGTCIRYECPYSHAGMEDDFCQEYLEENADYLIKLHQQNSHLSQISMDFIQKHDLLSRGSPKQQDSTTRFEFPFYLGVGSRVFPTPPEPNNCLKKGMSKKQQANEKPFSIRLSAKNRIPIPERISPPAARGMAEENQEGLQNGLLHDDPLSSAKIYQCIQLTPEQKWDKM